MKQPRIKILEIPFDPITEDQIIEKINANLINTGSQLFIATPNPEMLLEAKKHTEFKEILCTTDINIPDGIGILWAAEYLNSIKNCQSKTIKLLKGISSLPVIAINPKKIRSILPNRVTGTDLMQSICKNAPTSARIFLLGAAEAVAAKAKAKLQKKYNCQIVGTDDGAATPNNYYNLRELINAAKPDILFVAFGAPKQEIWLARNLSYLKTVKIAIGVGGAFDFIAGSVKRAPAAFQKLGLEWLWRLFLQPTRIRRIYRATIKFPLTIIGAAIKSKK